MKRVIILNGPPGSGKDFVVDYLKSKYKNVYQCQFKTELIRMTCIAYNYDYEKFITSYLDREFKETPNSQLNGLSPRQALIHVSEELLKPTIGKNIFGFYEAAKIRDHRDEDGIFIFTDGGFIEELIPVYNIVNGNMIVIRIHRDDCDFSNDSRSYIDELSDAKIFNIFNDGTELFTEEMEHLVRYSWDDSSDGDYERFLHPYKETTNRIEAIPSYSKVTLIGYTQPAEEFKDAFIDVKGLIAFCARVSNPNNQHNTDTVDRLIDYLKRNAHWSPFEMASATIEIETTRDIARQILRHRSFTFQEFSQRYANPSQALPFVTREARLQDNKNRQKSIDTENDELKTWWIDEQTKLIDYVQSLYSEAISRGIAKEQSRAILPEGLTMSRLYMHGTIRSFIHYIDLRSKNGTQKEHILVARAISEAISKIY